MTELESLIHAAQTAYQEERFDEAEDAARQALDLAGDNADALSLLGGVELWRQNAEAAVAWFARALEAAPADSQRRANLILALGALRDQKWSAGDFGAALEAVRRILGLDLEDWEARATLVSFLSMTRQKAQLSDFVTAEAAAMIDGKVLFIACFPKSGSTLLNRLLRETTGFDYGHAVDFYTDNEQDLSFRRMTEAARERCVMQHHTRATQANLQILQGFGIRPVILVRNLFDMVYSIHDFMYKNGARGAVFGFPERFADFPEMQRLDYVIDMVMPWYVGFYVSWFNAERRGDLSLHWQTYEDLVADPAGALGRVMKFYGLPVFGGTVEKAVERVDADRESTRFNQGVVGRGQGLSAAQRQRLMDHLAFFPDVDFSRVLGERPSAEATVAEEAVAKPALRPLYSRFF